MASLPDSSRAALGKMGNLKQLQKSLRTYVSKSNLSDASVILDKLDKLMDDESEEEMAAMEIQRCFRGHAGRQFFTVYRNNKILSNVQTVQRMYRGHMGRKLFHFLHKRANAVQRVWKGHLGRKLGQLRREFAGRGAFKWRSAATSRGTEFIMQPLCSLELFSSVFCV